MLNSNTSYQATPPSQPQPQPVQLLHYVTLLSSRGQILQINLLSLIFPQLCLFLALDKLLEGTICGGIMESMIYT